MGRQRGEPNGNMNLYRIGELAKAANISERTIDYYTKLGLISPESRSKKNYRLYGSDALTALERIQHLKREKFTLEEIKDVMGRWKTASNDDLVLGKLAELEIHMQQLEREVKALEPIMNQLRPNQARRAVAALLPQGAACMEAIRILLSQTPPM